MDAAALLPCYRINLDGASSDPPVDESLRPPASQKKALPYFMPSADVEARRRAITGQRTDDDDDDLPDYIDPDAVGDASEELVIGVDSSHVRSEAAPPPVRGRSRSRDRRRPRRTRTSSPTT